MYTKNTYRMINSNEYEIYFFGNYGAKGEKRGKRKKPTPEQIKINNQKNRIRKIRRKIENNFFTGDMWVTLKYPKGTSKPLDEVLRDFKNFRGRLRDRYKKAGQVLKYIYRIEIGKRGGIHIHILINSIEGGYEILKNTWRHGINITPIYEAGGYEQLASYLVKEYEDDGQLLLFSEAERKKLSTYNCSKNLIDPKPEKKEYSVRTVRNILMDGPTPSEGYYIDWDSYECGENPFTGMSYIRYSERRIKEIGRSEYEKKHKRGMG